MDANKNLKPDNGHLTDEATALYVDALKLGKLNRLPEWMVEHVTECHPCKERITGLYALMPYEGYTGLERHPTFGRLSPARTWYRVAAAVALISIAGAAGFLLLNGPNGPPVHADKPQAHDSTAAHPPTTEHQEFAAAFAEDVEMESLVNFRSRSNGITVDSPGITAEIHEDLTFSWKGFGAATIYVYNNRRELQGTIEGQRPPAIWSQALSPGLYYWKLTSEDELLFVGKFLVK
jgi:hypothetical protein